jgi:hypothetical protein
VKHKTRQQDCDTKMMKRVSYDKVDRTSGFRFLEKWCPLAKRGVIGRFGKNPAFGESARRHND